MGSNAGDHGQPRKRPWLAALLAVIYPGLGHLYLREWVRAILWFALIISATAVLLPASAIPSELSLEAILQVRQSLFPLRVLLAIFAMTLLSAVDAYWLAQKGRTEAAAAPDLATCPNCGKEVDEDLDFCHWCTTRLDDGPVEDDAA